MSETEFHTGKLTRLFIMKGTFEEAVTYLQMTKGIVFEDLDIENEDFWGSEPRVFYHADSETWWSIEDNEYDPESAFQTKLNEDNTIDYTFGFYNGGACFSEMIEEVLEKELK